MAASDDNDETPRDVEALLDAGEQLAGVEPRVFFVPHPESPNNTVPVILSDTRDGSLVHRRVELAAPILAELDRRQPGPRRREGFFRFAEVESFMDYLTIYGNPSTSLVYASPSRIVGVIDEHPPGADPDGIMPGGWRLHRAEFAPPASLEWTAWCSFDGKAMAQEAFADFVEARLEDVRSEANFPPPAELLTMARDLTVRTRGTFQRSIDVTTGAGVLISRVDNEPSASTIIPRAFVIGVPVYEMGEVYRVEARVRLNVNDSRASFTYTLHRRREIERDAFMGLRARIATAGFRVLAGAP
jgi:hypothetical protein